SSDGLPGCSSPCNALRRTRSSCTDPLLDFWGVHVDSPGRQHSQLVVYQESHLSWPGRCEQSFAVLVPADHGRQQVPLVARALFEQGVQGLPVMEVAKGHVMAVAG